MMYDKFLALTNKRAVIVVYDENDELLYEGFVRGAIPWEGYEITSCNNIDADCCGNDGGRTSADYILHIKEV